MAMQESTTLSPIKTTPFSDPRTSFLRLSHHSNPAAPTSTCHDVYYCTSPARVPFLWESQPGTPKIRSREFLVPPLTPPPSFYPISPGITSRKKTKVSLNKKSLFLRSPSMSMSCSSSSPNLSSIGSPVSKQQRVYGRRSCDSRAEETDDDEDDEESPISSLCFGGRHIGGKEGRRRWCSSPNVVKLLIGNF